MKADYIRTPQDLANEFDAVQKTVAARISRLPVTAEGLAYADAMRAIAAATTEDEDSLIAAREQLAATLPEFLAMDTAQAHANPAVPGPDQTIGL